MQIFDKKNTKKTVYEHPYTTTGAFFGTSGFDAEDPRRPFSSFFISKDGAKIT